MSLIFLAVQPGQALGAQAGKQQAGPAGAEASLTLLKTEALSYFTTVAGKITAVEGKTIRIGEGSRNSLKAGMRLNAYKEGVEFFHPVTKEPLGKMEVPIGNVEVTAARLNDSTGVIIEGKPEDFGNANVKIPGTKIRLLFCQGDVDWLLGDSYYQMLRESGRFELVDTGIDTDDIGKIAAEAKAKGAEAALVLSSEETKDSVNLTQRLYWVNDAKEFSEKKISIDASRVKDLKFKAGLFAPGEGEVLLSFHVPFNAKRMAVGDVDGDGRQEIALVSDDHVKIYRPGVDLKALWDFKVPSTDEVLWIDSLDINKDKKEELLITSMQRGEVVSSIYELHNENFVRLLSMKETFLRRLGGEIIAQQYTKADGYSGGVFTITYAGGAYKKGEALNLPEGINIYDFQYAGAPDGKKAILAWDERGRISLYNDKGIRMWTSRNDFGGFSRSFTREAPTVMVDRGKWAVKDRLVMREGEILAPKRKPLVGMAKGLGYSSSEIKSLWWNGVGVDERVFIEKLGGEILDYYPLGDKIIVLTKVPSLMKMKNLLKGESPFGVMLYVFSTKGR